MKLHLNHEMSDIAKRILLKKDVEFLSENFKIKSSSIVEVIAGRRKVEVEVIDSIQKLCKLRHDQQGIVIKKHVR